MTKIKTKKRSERPNPYRNKTDKELEAIWETMLEAYAVRLEYLNALPWSTDRIREMQADPAAFGMTSGEFGEWCQDVLEHCVEGAKMGDVAAERRRRLRDGERARVSALPSIDAMEDAIASHTPYGPPAPWKRSDETWAQFARRRESEWDEKFLHCGAIQGWYDGWEAFIHGGRSMLRAGSN